MDKDAGFWIKHLELTTHIEGGWYREVYRSPILLPHQQLQPSFPGDRNLSTHIFFLLRANAYSAFHRIRSDELWHFYTGDPIVVYELTGDGQLERHVLGPDIEKGQSLFWVVKAGRWFGSELLPGGSFGLVGCTVAPGFDFADFELADKNELLKMYPEHIELINRLAAKG